MLPQIEELLKYRPNRKDVIQLKEQLEDRSRKLVEMRDKAVVEATELQKAQRYPEAIVALQAVDPSVETPQVIELRKSVEQKNNQVLHLRKEIQEGVNKKQYHSLLEPVEALLTLAGTDEAIQKLRDQLLTRDENLRAQVEQIVTQANTLRERCQFKQAGEVLGKIPATRVTDDMRSLIDDCESLAFHREGTLPTLKRAVAEQKYAQGVQASNEYHSALIFSGIQDPEFHQLHQQCKQALAEQKAADIAAERLRANLRKTFLVGSAVGAGVVVLAVGFWIYSSVRSSMRNKAIADVIATQQWEAVLDLEPKNAFANSLGMAFKLIPDGKFRMGEGTDSRDVTLTRSYYLGVFEVTQEQYQHVMGNNPSSFKGAKNPVEQVSWDDAISFCKKLSKVPAEKSDGRVYRLPTEAEWEYACRAGTTTTYSFGDAESRLDDYAWYDNNSGGTTHAVGLKKPNALGLHDMPGNVWEWCQDWYGDYPSGALIDPRGPSGGTFRVDRGGSWGGPAAYCRAAIRGTNVPSFRSSNYGFRVALSPSVK